MVGQKKDHSAPRQSDPSLLLIVIFVFSCGALEIRSWQESNASVLWFLNKRKVATRRECSFEKVQQQTRPSDLSWTYGQVRGVTLGWKNALVHVAKDNHLNMTISNLRPVFISPCLYANYNQPWFPKLFNVHNAHQVILDCFVKDF